MSTEKTALEALREKIAVDNPDEAEKPIKSEDASDETAEDESTGAESTDADTAEAEEGSDEELDEAKDALEASEDEEEKLKKEKAAAKTQKEKDRIQRRIDKEVAKSKALEAEIAELKAQLAAKTDEDGDKLTKADAEKLAKDLANQAVSENEFINICNKIADDGESLKGADGKPLGKEFMKRVNSMVEDIGAPLPHDMIYILNDLDNGAEVLNHLADDENIDEAEKIYAMPPARKAIALTKLSTKLAEAKVKIKPISKVPDPNKPLGAGARATKQLTDNMTTDEWIAARNQQIAQRRQARGY